MRHLFPIELQRALAMRASSYSHLSRAMAKRGYRASKQFIWQLGVGERRVPPDQLKHICEVLQLTPEQARRLHRAAALDCGFDIGGLD